MSKRKRKRQQQQPARVERDDLGAALEQLDTAIAGLVDPQISYLNNQVVTGLSRYRQINEAIAGQQGNSNSRAWRSVAPIWLDAVRILADIDEARRDWATDDVNGRLPALPLPRPLITNTPDWLREMRKRAWRPHDAKRVAAIAKLIESWSTSIDHALDPPPKKEIAAPCPACEADYVQRPDSAGEIVRVRALQLVADVGCVCQECGASWPPKLFWHLSRVLECPTPAGVTEETEINA